MSIKSPPDPTIEPRTVAIIFLSWSTTPPLLNTSVLIVKLSLTICWSSMLAVILLDKGTLDWLAEVEI